MAFYLNTFILMLIICVKGKNGYTPNFNGVVYPADPFKFVGQTLELFCNITNTNIRENASALYFEHFINNKSTEVPSKYIEILTTKTIRLSKKNIQLSDNGAYICRLKTYQGNVFIDNQIVKVDFRPVQIKNFNCRVYNWESMLCTWDLGIQYKHPENINISLVYTQEPVNRGKTGTQYDCPVLNLTSCMWPTYEYHHGHLYYIQINVSTFNNNILLGYNTSSQYRVETQSYETSALAEQHNSSRLQAGIQPAPVEKLKAYGINSSCVNLTWTHSKRSREKFYKAYYIVNEYWREIFLNDKEVNNYYSQVCNLYAHTLYKFRIAVLPMPVQTSDSRQGYLSDWQYVEIKTSEDVPATSPDLCNGCFHECSLAIQDDVQCIQLIWKDLNATEKRGQITQYSVKALSMSNEILHTFVYSTQTPMITVAFEIKKTENPIKIELTPGTSIGFAQKSSQLIIPTRSKRPEPPSSFLVERETISNNTYHIYISWAALESCPRTNMKYTTVTILWCTPKEKKCQTNVNWNVLEANLVTHELMLTTPDLMIGISAEVFDGSYILSSGIIWARCIYTRNQVPQHPPKDVRMSSAHDLLKNSVHIVWKSSECSEEKSFIIEYLIKYCPTANGQICSDREKTENISNHENNEVVLKNLKGNTKYMLQIQAVSSVGLGPPSDPFVFEVEDAPQDSQAKEVSIIVIAIFIFISTVACLVCTFLRCHKRKEVISRIIRGQEESNHGSDKRKKCKKKVYAQKKQLIQSETDSSATENSYTSVSGIPTVVNKDSKNGVVPNNSGSYMRINCNDSMPENSLDSETLSLKYCKEASSVHSNLHLTATSIISSTGSPNPFSMTLKNYLRDFSNPFSTTSKNSLKCSPSLNNTSSGILVDTISFNEQESGCNQMQYINGNSASTDTESIPYCQFYGDTNQLRRSLSVQSEPGTCTESYFW